MNGELHSGDSEDSVFAVSAEWFHTWQRFVRGDSEGKLHLFDCVLMAVSGVFKACGQSNSPVATV